MSESITASCFEILSIIVKWCMVAAHIKKIKCSLLCVTVVYQGT